MEDCLSSLCRQTYTKREIILVDNGSTDSSVLYVKRNFPDVKIVELPDNTGFTGGNAAGLKATDGEFVVNNNTREDGRWLEKLIQPMSQDARSGSAPPNFSSRVVRINSAADGLTTAGVGFNRGLGVPSGLYDDPQLVFGACGAAVLYRRKMLDEIGFLDGDFFLYDEDTDLNFRAHLACWRCVYVPEAVLEHKGNATSIRLSSVHVYYQTRNLEFVGIKNMPALLMLRFAHHKLLEEIGSFCYLCLRHGKWVPYFRGKIDALKMLPRMWEKRRAIQARRVPNSYLRSLMTSMFTFDFCGAEDPSDNRGLNQRWFP